MQYLVRSGWAALRGAAWGCQAVQVCHDDYSCLPQINGQVIILRQCKVAQKTLIWAQRGWKDLRAKVVRYKTWKNSAAIKVIQWFNLTSISSSGTGSSLLLWMLWKRCRRGSKGALVPWVERSLSISLVPLSQSLSSSRTADSSWLQHKHMQNSMYEWDPLVLPKISEKSHARSKIIIRQGPTELGCDNKSMLLDSWINYKIFQMQLDSLSNHFWAQSIQG